MRIEPYGHMFALVAADRSGTLHEFWVDADSRAPGADTDDRNRNPGVAHGFLVVALLVEALLVATLVTSSGLPLA
jgi:hypothetical protein